MLEEDFKILDDPELITVQTDLRVEMTSDGVVSGVQLTITTVPDFKRVSFAMVSLPTPFAPMKRTCSSFSIHGFTNSTDFATVGVMINFPVGQKSYQILIKSYSIINKN